MLHLSDIVELTKRIRDLIVPSQVRVSVRVTLNVRVKVRVRVELTKCIRYLASLTLTLSLTLTPSLTLTLSLTLTPSLTLTLSLTLTPSLTLTLSLTLLQQTIHGSVGYNGASLAIRANYALADSVDQTLKVLTHMDDSGKS
jgi:hypothetical protein